MSTDGATTAGSRAQGPRCFAAGRAVLRPKNRLESDRCCAQRYHYRDCTAGALSHSRNINSGEVIEALVATDWRHVTLAALFVAGSYFTLTFYDLFALRTIGRSDVPYWAAAIASFTSYSVGHNVGASVFTGGAVRYRIYSAWGLKAIEVAKICFVAGLTFWLGNARCSGSALRSSRLPPAPSTNCRNG